MTRKLWTLNELERSLYTHSAILIMRLSELTTEIWKKTDAYNQRQKKCSPGTLLDCIKFIRIFAGILWQGSFTRQ